LPNQRQMRFLAFVGTKYGTVSITIRVEKHSSKRRHLLKLTPGECLMAFIPLIYGFRCALPNLHLFRSIQ
ncbi:MAG: hypothetical protein OXI67_10890, partial [Candidatus Poribacteria bacterium]|nr:hypothetical protein [Candidatus Poribacteria bacterium]